MPVTRETRRDLLQAGGAIIVSLAFRVPWLTRALAQKPGPRAPAQTPPAQPVPRDPR